MSSVCHRFEKMLYPSDGVARPEFYGSLMGRVFQEASDWPLKKKPLSWKRLFSWYLYRRVT